MTFNFSNSFQRPWFFAHRGASEEFPQNTMLAFDMAVKQGADGIETDLRYTKDREIICFHDLYLGRLSTITGKISDTSIKEISRAKVKHKTNSSQAIPTLNEFLTWLPKETSIILELKDNRFGNLEHADSLLNVLEKFGVIEKTILASFSMTHLKWVKKILPTIVTCFVTPYNLSPNLNADVVEPYFPILWLNPAYTDTAHKLKKLVSVWDPHPENRVETYLRQKVDILIGDNPTKLFNAISMISPGHSKVKEK